MNLNSRVCEILEIEKPIVLAGMGGASCPALAAAVSNAGGLGVLGAAGCGPNQLRQWIRETRELTDRPFGVDTLLPASVRRANYEDMEGPTPADLLPERKDFAAEFMAKEGLEPVAAGSTEKPQQDGPPIFTAEFFEAQMEVIIQERVPVYASGLGNPGPWMSELRANGTKVMAVVVRCATPFRSSPQDWTSLLPRVTTVVATTHRWHYGVDTPSGRRRRRHSCAWRWRYYRWPWCGGSVDARC